MNNRSCKNNYFYYNSTENNAVLIYSIGIFHVYNVLHNILDVADDLTLVVDEVSLIVVVVVAAVMLCTADNVVLEVSIVVVTVDETVKRASCAK